MLIITRYKAAKLTGVTEAVFSRMWKRQEANEFDYEFFTEDGKIKADHSAFTSKYADRIKLDVLEKIKNPKVKAKTKTVVKKKVIDKKEKPKKVKEVKIKDPPPETETNKNNNESEEMMELRAESNKAKLQKIILDKNKAELDYKKSRAELAELATIGQACIGYCVALNQTLFDQPRSFIDELKSGIKAGKSTTDLTDIARKPAMEAVAESIELIKKEIARYKRDIKSDKK